MVDLKVLKNIMNIIDNATAIESDLIVSRISDGCQEEIKNPRQLNRGFLFTLLFQVNNG